MKSILTDYPQPKESLLRFAHELFDPVKQGLCITCHFVSGSGKRTLVKCIMREHEFLNDVFGKELAKTLFVFVDPDEVLADANEAYLQLMLSALLIETRKKKIRFSRDLTSNPLLLLKQYLSELVEAKWHTVFLYSDFEYTLNLSPSIFRNLESMLSLNKALISFVFLSTTNLLDETVLPRFHNLKYAVNRVVRYHALLDHDEKLYVLDTFLKKYKITLSEEIKTLILKICGGHTQLLKYAVSALSEKGDVFKKDSKNVVTYLQDHPQLKDVCADIWSFLSPSEQDIIKGLMRNGSLPQNNSNNKDFLLGTKLVQQDVKGKYGLFGDLFSQYVEQKIPQETLTYDDDSSHLFLGTRQCSDAFTLQEFKLIVHFVKNSGNVISRDAVGEVLWGKNSVDKYSDWMVDKIISTIRKKLDRVGFPSDKLVTLKKRGFYLEN